MEIEILKNKFLKQGIDFEFIHHDMKIKSKQDAIGIFNIEKSAPTLILKTDLGFYALIISGERERIDFKSIKTLLKCKKVEMAKKDIILKEFGLEAGNIPLTGHNLPCIFDKKIMQHEYIFGGTGNWNYTLKIKPVDLIKANNVVLYFE